MAAKKKTGKKQNAIQRFVRETAGELRKVSWPSREEAWHLTVIVIITMLIVGLLLSGVSGIASRLMNLMLGI